jgi:signal transduction histidine kinase
MTWGWFAGASAVAATAFSVGWWLGTMRARARVRRVREGISRIAAGNVAHRVLLPGADEAARAADAVNELADAIQLEREISGNRDEAQRRLIANISHDLRTPIASIAGYTDALQRGLSDDHDRYLGVIAAKTEDLAQLTDDLFYAARIDAGDLQLRATPVDLAEATRRALLGFEPQLAAAGVSVSVRVCDERRSVEGDASAIARILGNLIGNSIRHGDGLTELGVTLDETPGNYTVRITNDGPPLPTSAESLFERGATGPSGGTGLGLAIARELAERMGGSIRAGADSDGQVSFAFSMPRQEFSGS